MREVKCEKQQHLRSREVGIGLYDVEGGQRSQVQHILYSKWQNPQTLLTVTMQQALAVDRMASAWPGPEIIKVTQVVTHGCVDSSTC
jgi:hypothetical protein